MTSLFASLNDKAYKNEIYSEMNEFAYRRANSFPKDFTPIEIGGNKEISRVTCPKMCINLT